MELYGYLGSSEIHINKVHAGLMIQNGAFLLLGSNFTLKIELFSCPNFLALPYHIDHHQS